MTKEPRAQRRCILHIGMHKTGSSSIQQTLHGRLHTPAFAYPDFGQPNHSVAINRAFRSNFLSPHDRAHGLVNDAARRDSERVALAEAIESCASETVVISAEALSMLTTDDLIELKAFLAQWFSEFHIVGYVRAPFAMIESWWQQQLKSGVPSLQDSLPNYRDRFEKFDHLFGRGQVQLWKFDPARFPESCVVRDFCRRLSIPLQREWIVRANAGLSREALALLHAYRLHYGCTASPVAWRNEARMVNLLRSMPGAKLRFASAMLRDIAPAIAADVRWMEDRLGESLAEAPSREGIASLEELYSLQPSTLQWLERHLGYPLTNVPTTAEQLAKWCAELAVSGEGS